MTRDRPELWRTRTALVAAWIWVIGVLVGYMIQFGPILEHLAGVLTRAAS